MSIGPLASVPVGDDEQLARVVLSERHIRRSDGTVRAEAFLPYKRVKLSVIRHTNLEETTIWELSRLIAAERSLTLYGRGDIAGGTPRIHGLEVNPEEPPLNHADIVGWPPDKPSQMSIAQEIAAHCPFISAQQAGAIADA